MTGELATPCTHALLALADRAEALVLDSVWIGDSLLAKPRHEPLSLLSIDDDEVRALAKLDQFQQEYYKQPGETIRRRQYCFAGSRSGATDSLREFAAAGATHLALRFIGEHERQMELVARMRGELN